MIATTDLLLLVDAASVVWVLLNLCNCFFRVGFCEVGVRWLKGV